MEDLCLYFVLPGADSIPLKVSFSSFLSACLQYFCLVCRFSSSSSLLLFLFLLFYFVVLVFAVVLVLFLLFSVLALLSCCFSVVVVVAAAADLRAFLGKKHAGWW